MRKWPSFTVIRDFYDGLKELVKNPGPFIPPCLIDGSKQVKIGETSDGHPVYECEYGHTFSPGVNVGDRDKLIEKTKGDAKGEI